VYFKINIFIAEDYRI